MNRRSGKDPKKERKEMVRILVDSASDYSIAEAKEKGIFLVPIEITLAGNTYIEGKNLGRDEFYELLAKTKEFPKTAQPSPQTFLDYFLKVKEAGDELVCILLSSTLSGTFQSAVLAKQMAEYDKIYLVDSLSATYPIKVLADYAFKLAAEGLPGAQIAEEAKKLQPRTRFAAAIDTLDYLQRGGRIGKAAALVGGLAKLKPIITLSPEGTLEVLGKCLGRNKAISFLIHHLKEQKLNPAFPLYSIYTYGNTNSDLFEKRLTAEGFVIQGRFQVGSTIGAHIGPEAFGIVYVTE